VDVALASAVELLAMLRARAISARELSELHLERIAELDPGLNAVVTLDAERALARADALDRKRAPVGPLHGLPVTIKDQFETAGLRTTCGLAIYGDHIPTCDADAVRRLREAGAIILGKTNVAEGVADWQSYNDLFGATNNPWDATRTPGGSSGGSAAAIASGLSALELGGDIGGSIRNPAAWCGVFGHKSSYGIVPQRGTLPAPPGSRSRTDIAVSGPIARSVDDLELALDVLIAPEPGGRGGWRVELPPARHLGGRDLRVALWFDDARYPIAQEIRDAYEDVVAALVASGAHVKHAKPDIDLHEMHELRRRLCAPIFALGLDDESFAAEVEGARTSGRDDAVQTHRDWLRLDETRQRIRHVWGEFFRDWDVCLVPPTQTMAILHDHTPVEQRTIDVDGFSRPYSELGSWISLAGVAYLPSTVAPVGHSNQGLPIGIEVVGPYLGDRTTMQVARSLGTFEAPPHH